MLIFNENHFKRYIFVIVFILYPLVNSLLEHPPQDYTTEEKTIKNLNIKKCDRNYCTHSRIHIARNSILLNMSMSIIYGCKACNIVIHIFMPS